MNKFDARFSVNSGGTQLSVINPYRALLVAKPILKTKSAVITVVMPKLPTVKTLAKAILAALGDKAAAGTTEKKVRRIHWNLRAYRVETIVIDEFQRLTEQKNLKQEYMVKDLLFNISKYL